MANRRDYAARGVPHYWIVDPDQRLGAAIYRTITLSQQLEREPAATAAASGMAG